MAKKTNKILPLLLGAGLLFFSSFTSKKYKASDGKVFATQQERDAHEQSLIQAKKEAEEKKNNTSNTTSKKEVSTTNNDRTSERDAIADAENYYQDRVFISDATLQWFNRGGGKYNGKYKWDCHVWVRFKNMSDIPVTITTRDIAATVLFSDSIDKIQISAPNGSFTIPKRTETNWMLLGYHVDNGNYPLFNESKIVKDFQSYYKMSMKYGKLFFLPCHLTIQYDITIPHQDFLLKDVIFDIDTECLSIPLIGGNSSLKELSVFGMAKKVSDYDGDSIIFNAGNTLVHESSKNMLDPSVNKNYERYLNFLRSNRSLTTGKYKGYPTRYILLEDKEKGKTTPTVPDSYTKFLYTGTAYPTMGFWKGYIPKKSYPYLGIVYDKNGYVAYA